MKTCPFCAEDIKDAAIVCKHCGQDVPPSVSGDESGEVKQNPQLLFSTPMNGDNTKEIQAIQQFKDQSTAKLVGLGIVTYGVYLAYYIKRQTARINTIIGEEERISKGFVDSIMALSYISLILFFAYLIVDEGHPVEIVSDITDRVWTLMLLIWGFKARNRIHSAYEITTEDTQWFHGFWTFIFSPMYFNYKINCICGDREEQEWDAAHPREPSH